jgi:hypothetical protein
LYDAIRHELNEVFHGNSYQVPNSKLPKSYTIEPDVNDYVEATKGDRSASKRVNELLKRAIIQEQYEQLEREAARFFAAESGDRSTAGPSAIR